MNLIKIIIAKVLLQFIKPKEKTWNANGTSYHIR